MAATVSDKPNDQAVALLHRLVSALEDDAPRPSRFERWGKTAAVFATPVTILLSAVGIVVTIFLTSAQLDASSQQFDRTWRQSQYSDIVDGLASSSVGVQVNSIRRLVQYVADKRNFENDDEQEAAAQNAAQTLAAFMTDESQLAGDDGLSNYRDPQPVVVSRAFTQLDDLVDTGLSVALDLSKGNFHGVYEPGLRPNSSFLIRGADFRGATLARLDLTKVPSPQLQSAFFTCTDLQGAKLGSADVSGADFTGANLGAADLSHVRGLTSAQLSGARVGPVTRLPKGVHAPPQPSWGVEDDANFGPTDACKKLLEAMTHLLAGTGYSDRLPCPAVHGSRWQVRLSSVENDARQRVCSFRDRMNHSGYTDPSAARQRAKESRANVAESPSAHRRPIESGAGPGKRVPVAHLHHGVDWQAARSGHPASKADSADSAGDVNPRATSVALAWAARRPGSGSVVARLGRKAMLRMSSTPAQRSQSSK